MPREDGFFDDLARGLADGTLTRGKALRLMGAAVVGGALGSLGIGEASADPIGCKRNGKTCTRNDQCCSGNCESGTCSTCPSGRELLSNGTCALPCTTREGCFAAGCDPNSTGCEVELGGGDARYCRNSGGLTSCTSTADCPSGQFCVSPEGACARTC